MNFTETQRANQKQQATMVTKHSKKTNRAKHYTENYKDEQHEPITTPAFNPDKCSPRVSNIVAYYCALVVNVHIVHPLCIYTFVCV